METGDEAMKELATRKMAIEKEKRVKELAKIDEYDADYVTLREA